MQKFDKDKLWQEVLESLRVIVSGPVYTTWISQTHLSSLRKVDKKRYIAEIGCNSGFVKQTVEKRYFGLTQDALMKAIDAPCDLTFIVKSQKNSSESPTNNKKEIGMAPLFEDNNTPEELMNRVAEVQLRPGFTFRNFAVSGSNQLAHAAALAVADNPGVAYNPLFIWGGVGVGKTHLMHAVGYSLLEKNLETKIVACTGEDFTNDIVEGIRNKTTQLFRNKYRKNDALFIDDVQFIAGKETVQEEFFHTFNAVLGKGGQIIMTSDKPPSEIPKIEERLRSRFEAGMIVDIAQPDFELRCAIIEIKARDRGLELTNEQIQTIAGNQDSARKIEGFLTKLSSEAKIKNQEIDNEFVRNLIGKGYSDQDMKKKVSPDEMIKAVCTHYSVGKRAILGKARTKIVARPRQILMYLLRTELDLPLEEVGRIVGGRDHTTIMHGVDKITLLASEDVDTREDIMRIKKYL